MKGWEEMKKRRKFKDFGIGGIPVRHGLRRTSHVLFRRWSVPLLLGVVACLWVRVYFAPEIYNADCKCAMAERTDSIVTNESGDVVQPLERMLQQGTYVDMKQFVSCFLGDCLAGRHFNRKPIETFVADPSNTVFSADQVTNAFDSIEYEVNGDYVASFRISARAQDGGLALKVVDHVVREMELILGEYNKVRREKATAQILESIQRLRRRGEDYSQEQRKYESALKVCEKTEPRMEVLQPPRLSKSE